MSAFLLTHRDAIVDFHRHPSDAAFERLLDCAKETSNNCSVVLLYLSGEPLPSGEQWSVLFTGDAGREVLLRLMAGGPVEQYRTDDNVGSLWSTGSEERCLPQVHVLKVPHHGSRYSIDGQILRAIRPDIAIVSHGNKRFGQDSDTHPHMEVVRALDAYGCRILYTNDVKKQGAAPPLHKKPASDSFGDGVYYSDW